MVEPRRCASCGASLGPFLPTVVDPQSGQTYRVLRCASCGLGHTDPMPSDVAASYGDLYYGERRHGLTGRMRAWLRARYVERWAGRAGKLLDAGCGTGEFLSVMSARGWSVAGTELDHRARQLAPTGLDVRPSLADHAEHAPFDVVTMWHSLEHVTEPARQVDAAFRLLRPGGKLVVAVPDFGGLEARVFGRHGFGLDVPRHLYHFDQRSLAQMLLRSGFDIETVGHQEFEYDVMCWLQSPLNVCLEPPHALFNWIIGRPLHRTPGQLASSLALGAALLPAAVIAAAIAVAAGRGSVLKVQARKPTAPPRV